MDPRLAPLFARRSVRTFAPGVIDDATERSLLDAAMAAPSARACDPWRFITVRSPTTLAAISARLPFGKMLPAAGLGIVVCGELAAANGGELSYLLQDCSAAIENLLLAASLLGLGAVWLGVHPRDDRIAHLRSVLHLPDGVLPIAVIAVGHPAEAPPPRTRFDPAKVRAETWG